METIAEMIWYASWPVVIYLSVKFVQLNLNHYKKMERLEELEEYFAQNEAAKN
ncbi:hypothetical protein [Sulfurimonas sp.]|uniref:hypothetical protein n=1 Tax=Sulfurimonas sp. TaxID=2022749 RepID=UPI002627B1F0|nr:hypothetical protein [Sulfurimonas sp.]